jgi:ribose 5-phosphate isomerase B
VIYLGADHGGYDLKEKVKAWLEEWGREYKDLGNGEKVPDDDYPVYAKKVAEAIINDKVEETWSESPKGIIICRSGGGMIIAVNRYRGIRAVYADNEVMAQHARSDNNANIIGLAADWISDEKAKATIMAWLATEFTGETRHVRRINMLDDFEV